MSKITVNVLIELDGKTYKTSNGMNVIGEVREKDIMNLVNFGAKQLVSEIDSVGAMISSNGYGTAQIESDVLAQDAVEVDE